MSNDTRYSNDKPESPGDNLTHFKIGKSNCRQPPCVRLVVT